MDSEDSRPASSASNSSSNSSHNSEQSHPFNNSDEKPRSPEDTNDAAASPASSSRSRQSRRSRSMNGGSQRSQSKSDSDSSSSSMSDNDDEEPNFDNAQAAPSPSMEPEKAENETTRQSSESPRRSARGSRSRSASSSSSNPSRNNSEERHHQASEMNLSHEDLSDVSDLESEKRTSIFNNSKQSVDDDSTNGVMDDGLSKDKMNNEDSKSHSPIMDLRQKLEKMKSQSNEAENNAAQNETEGKALNGKGMVGESLEDLVKTHDDDALDFEAEEGECNDVSKDDEKSEDKAKTKSSEKQSSPKKNDGEEEELEEGEVSDEDEKRPEETEPKPVCRFYTRGQCTWGMSCRFLHPGVTDKGNYTMFDLVRPVPLLQGGSVTGNRPSGYNLHTPDYHDYRTERPSLHHRSAIPHTPAVFAPAHEARPAASEGPVVVESAWERGLRTAKEMMRKANKRKEQDMDFEDKKMHLTLSPDELEKDPYYAKDRLSPAEAVRHPIYPDAISDAYASSDRYARGPPAAHYDEVDPYGRSARYRELPPHRMPQYEDDRRLRPAREVIVQRVEPVGRGDEWNDPWMRSKSPGGRGSSRDRGDKRRRDRRSYSSNSSYSSSSSSQSDSSSDSSRSLSSRDHHRRRYASNSHKSPPPSSRRPGGRSLRSPSPPPRRSRRTPTIDELNNDITELKSNIVDKEKSFLKGLHHSPSSKRRTNTSISPVYNRGSAYSPVHKKKRVSPVVKKAHASRAKVRRRHSSSSSDSDSTASDSESDTGSSSSGSSSRSRENTPPKRSRVVDKANTNERKGVKKVDPPKKRSPITIELRKPAAVGVSALASPTHSSTSERDSKKSRREELLKQLRAVEDAIAKKRSKLA
ncbi:zinc finger CCCH domain-containing protein 18 isoform X2 [Stomoxys calcitrans]|uniref:zinc finger CCCH domain-containing protein 18 isoform X2 n=1 Tax=Stomoxys calcitrans TaxID=35570 RepID=UPI0027E342A7|nr:zinc finger CCCH domain-containing protein 18 isoform X2 [Stomoxys calcitrans]